MKLISSIVLICITLFSAFTLASKKPQTINPIKFGTSLSEIKNSNLCKFTSVGSSGIADEILMCDNYHYNGNQYLLTVFFIDDKAQKSMITFNQQHVNDGLKYLFETGDTPTYADTEEAFTLVDEKPNQHASIVMNNGLTRYTMQSDPHGYVFAGLMFSSQAFLQAEKNQNGQVKHQQQNNEQQEFLSDFNGVWAIRSKAYKIKLTGTKPSLLENSVPFPIIVKDIDYDNDIAHLQVVAKKMVIGDIYLRKVTSGNNSYYLTMSVNDEAPKNMSFVRKLN